MKKLFQLHSASPWKWWTTIWCETRKEAVRAFERHTGPAAGCDEMVMYRGCFVDRTTAEQMQQVTHATIDVPHGVEGIRL